MKRWIPSSLLILSWLICAGVYSVAQEAPAQAQRKVISRVDPTFPQVVHNMHLKGKVVLEVSVEASGSVKAVKALGGSPILVQSATYAVEKWKWERGSEATKELVRLTLGSP